MRSRTPRARTARIRECPQAQQRGCPILFPLRSCRRKLSSKTMTFEQSSEASLFQKEHVYKSNLITPRSYWGQVPSKDSHCWVSERHHPIGGTLVAKQASAVSRDLDARGGARPGRPDQPGDTAALKASTLECPTKFVVHKQCFLIFRTEHATTHIHLIGCMQHLNNQKNPFEKQTIREHLKGIAAA